MSHSCRQTLCETPHYEDSELPPLKEIECPIKERFQIVPECSLLMDGSALSVHITEFHKEYEADPEPYFDAVRERRFK